MCPLSPPTHPSPLLRRLDSLTAVGACCDAPAAAARACVRVQSGGKAEPLAVILSTPTGSGKTYTAVMIVLQMLTKKHTSGVLLYSVPTKQVSAHACMHACVHVCLGESRPVTGQHAWRVFSETHALVGGE